VGALTHRPWAFIYRPWELRKTESIDVMDAVGSNIRVDARGREVLRILPRNNDAVNEEWISDKTRFVADGLRTQRLDRPYVRKDGRLEPASWDEALALVAAKLKAAKPERIGAIAGDLAGAEEMFALRDLLVRWIMPIVWQPVPNQPSTPETGVYGLGDMVPTFFLSPKKPGKLIWGAGPVLQLPTATNTFSGTGEAGIGAIRRSADSTRPLDFGAPGEQYLVGGGLRQPSGCESVPAAVLH
jgi:hypothetical protein